jgi:hypothetical protein
LFFAVWAGRPFDEQVTEFWRRGRDAEHAPEMHTGGAIATELPATQAILGFNNTLIIKINWLQNEASFDRHVHDLLVLFLVLFV